MLTCEYVIHRYGAYASYSVSLKGRQFTQGSSTKQLLLKVPQCERQRDAKLKEKLEALKESGVDLSRIPQSELKAGQGETLSAEMQWVDLLASYRKQGTLRTRCIEFRLRH